MSAIFLRRCCRPFRVCIKHYPFTSVLVCAFLSSAVVFYISQHALRNFHQIDLSAARSDGIKPRFIKNMKRYEQNISNQNDPMVSRNDSIITHGSSFDRLYLTKENVPAVFNTWLKNMKKDCQQKFKGYGSIAAMTHDVIIDRTKTIGRRGGEKFETLMNQVEDVEFFRYRPGFMKMPCRVLPHYKFKGNTHQNKWMASMTTSTENEAVVDVIHNFTIAITRYEYVNLYHTMTDFYNAFLLMAFLNKTQHQTIILIVDGHPAGSLDDVWGTIFNSAIRVGHLRGTTRFTNLAFGILGYHSPIFEGTSDFSMKSLPLSDEFREFFLSSYNLPIKFPLRCDSLNILFIWRRDYIAHPRNPSGLVHRKIENEEQLVAEVKRVYPNFRVRGVQADRFDFKGQLKFISETDILIGMHGAALSHSLFLPRGRALVELMPNYINPAWKKHFIVMATWRELIYKRWVNKNASLEHKGFSTTVPPNVILSFLKEIVKEMCPQK